MPKETPFTQSLYASGLVESSILDRSIREAGAMQEKGDLFDLRLGEILLSKKQLNPWQISQLLEGRTKFTLGRYVIVDSLGQGGYGQVFLARDPELSQFVALKVLPMSRATPDVVARFQREVKLQAGFHHPNLIRLLDSGQDGNAWYAVHEYMDGGDARQKIRRELQFPIRGAVQLVIDVADALEYLHHRGIIHRDIKPANILLNSEGVAKLGDFGFCGFLTPQTDSIHKYGKLVGTADYMAPDHIRNPKAPSPLWDIYSLGCTFYQTVTGMVPFPKGDSHQKIIAHVRSEPMDPRVFRQDLPHELAHLINEMMDKSPEKRVQNAMLVARRLRDWLDKSPLSAEELLRLPQVADVSLFKEILNFSNEAVFGMGPAVESTKKDEPFRVEDLDLNELKSETIDFSSSQCLVTLPVHHVSMMIPVPPVIKSFDDTTKSLSQNHVDFLESIKPLILFIVGFISIFLCFLLLVLTILLYC